MVRKTCFLVVLSLLVLFSKAENVSQAPEPDWLYKTSPNFSKTPSIKDISNGYFLDLLDRQINLEKSSEYIHITRHIVNESGVQNASEVSVSFDPSYQKVLFHKISVIRNGIVINQFDISKIKVVQEETDANDFQYNGTKRAFISLVDIRKDDKIDFSYTLVGMNPVYGSKFSDNFYLTTTVSVTNYYFTIIAPKNRPLDIKYFNEATVAKKYILKETRYYHWDNPALKLSETQKSVPSWFNNYPYFDVTEYKDWKEVINWGLNLFDNYQKKLSTPVLSKINEWNTIAKGDTSVFIGLATSFVQDQIRYLGIETGLYTHHPHDPSTIFKQRFGDCKDKAFLLTSILQYNGVKAYVALVSTDLVEKIVEQSPGTFNFNHAIVAIERSNSYQFIDATLSYQKGDIRNRFIPAYGSALVLKEGASEFSNVKAGPIRKTSIHEIFNVKASSKGPSTLKVETIYEGGSADDNRANFAENSFVEMQKGYKEFYGKYYDSLELESELIFHDDSLNNKLITTESYNINSIWQIDDKKKETMNVYAAYILNLLPDPAAAYKKAPLGISFPTEINYSIELHMPSTWTFPKDDYSVNNDSFEFSFKIENKDSIIILKYRFKTLKEYIDESSLARYKDDYSKIQSRLSYTLTNHENSIDYKGANLNGMSDFSISWKSLFFSISILIGCFFIFKYLNQQQTNQILSLREEKNIGGWLWVLGIGLIMALMVNLANVYVEGFYNANYWNSLANDFGQDLRPLFITEELVRFILLPFLVFLIYLFFKKRDIFPKMFVHFVIISFLSNVILALSYNLYKLPTNFSEKTTEIGRSITSILFYGIIWGTYIFRSSRVKATFVKPYSDSIGLKDLSTTNEPMEESTNENNNPVENNNDSN